MQLTGEKLHKMFTAIKSRTYMSGANYFRDREVFKKMAEELNTSPIHGESQNEIN